MSAMPSAADYRTTDGPSAPNILLGYAPDSRPGIGTISWQLANCAISYAETHETEGYQLPIAATQSFYESYALHDKSLYVRYLEEPDYPPRHESERAQRFLRAARIFMAEEGLKRPLLFAQRCDVPIVLRQAERLRLPLQVADNLPGEPLPLIHDWRHRLITAGYRLGRAAFRTGSGQR